MPRAMASMPQSAPLTRTELGESQRCIASKEAWTEETHNDPRPIVLISVDRKSINQPSEKGHSSLPEHLHGRDMVIINTRRPPYGERGPTQSHPVHLVKCGAPGCASIISWRASWRRHSNQCHADAQGSANASNAIVRRGCVGLANRIATNPSAGLPSPIRQGAERSGVIRLLELSGLRVLAKGELAVSKAEEPGGGAMGCVCQCCRQPGAGLMTG
jgi:hypothetical protein